MRSLEKRWVKGATVSPSALCPQIPPLVPLLGAGLAVSKWPVCSQTCAIGTKPLWPQNPYLTVISGGSVDHTCIQLAQGDDGIAFA